MAGPSTPMALSGQEQNQSNYQPANLAAGDYSFFLDEIGVQRPYLTAFGSLTADRAIIGPNYPGATYEIDDTTTRNGHVLTFRTSLGAGVALPAGVRSKVVCKADGSDYVFSAGAGPAGTVDPANGVIFKPGTPSVGNQVATWTEVKAAIAVSHGAVFVYLDDTIAPCVVDVGVTDCVGKVEFRTLAFDLPSILHLPEGAILLNPSGFSDVKVLCEGTATASLFFSYSAPAVVLNLRGRSEIKLDAACTHSPIEVADGDTFAIAFDYHSKLIVAGAAGGTCVVSLGAGSTFQAFTGGNADNPVSSDSVKGPVGSTLQIITDTSLNFVPTVASMLGTITITRFLPWSTGNLAARPTNNLVVGQMYFDTTLDCAEWWDGTKWVGAASASQVIVFSTALATVSSATSLAAGWFVLDAKVQLVTPYTAGATMTLGQTALPQSFATASDINLQGTAGDIFDIQQFTTAAANPVKATIAGAPAVGAANVIVTYAVSPQP